MKRIVRGVNRRLEKVKSRLKAVRSRLKKKAAPSPNHRAANRTRYQLFLDNAVIGDGTIRVYGQFDGTRPSQIEVRNGLGEVYVSKIIHDQHRDDFCVDITIPDELGTFGAVQGGFTFTVDGVVLYRNVAIRDPLTWQLADCHVSAAISTMVRDEAHRVLEWIDYNLALGFELILVFLNNTTDDIVEKIRSRGYRGVICIPFNYHPFPGFKPNTVQRVHLAVAANVLKTHCDFLSLIDVDEFIVCPQYHDLHGYIRYLAESHPGINAVRFTSFWFSAQHKFVVNQNVIDQADIKFQAQGYYKMLLKSTHLGDFLNNPHSTSENSTPMNELTETDTDKLYYAHYWLAERRPSSPEWVKTDEVRRFRDALEGMPLRQRNFG